jgi:hypothetical protein
MQDYPAIRLIRALAILVVLTVVGCGGQQGKSGASVRPSATPTSETVRPFRPLVVLASGQAITEQEVRAVVDGVFVKGIFDGDPTLFAECQYYRGGAPSFKACPLTPRLEARLTSKTGKFPPRYGAGAFCRCLDVSPDIGLSSRVFADHSLARVALFQGTETVDLVLVPSGGHLLVDDIECNGKGPSSSVYLDPIPPCT